MKKVFLVLISLVIMSMSITLVAHGDEDKTVSLPIIPIPQQTGDDWETSDISFDSAISVSDCTVSSIKNQTYTGKKIKPSPTLKYNGASLKKGRDYTLSYKSNTNVGTAYVIITGKGDYSGSVTAKFSIIPKSTVLSKVTSPKKGVLKAVWKKQAVQTTGYQLQYSNKKSFKNSKTLTVKKVKTVKKTVKKLTSGKKCFVRIRTYKKVGKKNYYSAWSKALNTAIK